MTDAKIGARFRFVKHSGDPENSNFDSGWHDNLVLDSGLARMLTGNYAEHLCIGASNTPVDNTQTGLINFITWTNTTIDQDVKLIETSGAMCYASVTRTFRFPASDDMISLSEAGLGWYNELNISQEYNNCFNRILIKNKYGNNVSIQKNVGDILDVIVELVCYLPKNIFGSFIVNGDNSEQTLISYFGNVVLSENGINWPSNGISAGPIYCLSSPISNDHSTMSGDSSNQVINVTTGQGPEQRSLLVSANLESSELAYTHSSIEINIINGILNGTSSSSPAGYKMNFSPELEKSPSKKLKYDFVISWGRYNAN